MAKSDWNEIIDIFEKKQFDYIDDFINSKEIFAPDFNHPNIFLKSYNAFSATLLNKTNPGNWIPIYKREDLSEFLINNNLMPIRCGQGEFFFFKGKIIFDLEELVFKNIAIKSIEPIDDFIPLTLEKFHKNENAYLNKALAIGIINHFLDSDKLRIFEKEIHTKNYRRLLYGQFGKIKTSFELEFKTLKGSRVINKGFQFEMDLVLENKNEIIVFEAKQGVKKRKSFSLLQLYYPLIYLKKITDNKKKIRTIFIDVISTKKEIYKLTEFEFINTDFDNVIILNSNKYIS